MAAGKVQPLKTLRSFDGCKNGLFVAGSLISLPQEGRIATVLSDALVLNLSILKTRSAG
jgi:hypothetical protein